MMSCNRRAGRSEGNGPILIDLLLKALVADGFLDHIHCAPQNLSESIFQTLQAFNEAEAPTGRILGESHSDINIVSWDFIARSGSKQCQSSDAGGAQFVLVGAQDLDGLLSVHQLYFPANCSTVRTIRSDPIS
jgi:hypothetical protein